MREHDKLTVIPNIKEPSKSTIHYRTSVEVARDNYCDTLMKYLSDVNFINPPSIEEREKVLNRELYSLMCFCRNAFYEIYIRNIKRGNEV